MTRLLSVLFCLLAATVLVRAQDRLTIAPRFVPALAKPGDEVTLEIAIEIEDGYHVYGKTDPTEPTRLKIVDAAGLEPVGESDFPLGDPHTAFGQTNFWVKGKAVLRQQFKVPPSARNGALKLRGLLVYLACTEEYCDPPGKDPVSVVLQIEGGTEPVVGNGEPVPPGPPPDGSKPVPNDTEPRMPTTTPVLRQPLRTVDDLGDDDLGGSLWQLILLCIGGGLFALVMPCTYPMIPITFSFFTKQADARGGKVLPLALAYGAGIVLIFVGIGVAVGEVITVFAAHWLTNLLIGGAFVVFAFSLFGWIVLQPPQFANRLAGGARSAGGFLGVFLMGATLVISSFTCTAPIVGSLLASVATAGTGRVALGMAVFGLTMAAPFVVLALLPGRVKQLPKSGEWMNTLKVSLGFIELAAALKFFSNVDVALGLGLCPREPFLYAWAFAFTLLALFLFGLFAYREAPVAGVGTARNVCGTLSLLFAFYCLYGASGLPLDPVMTAFEPPYRLRKVEEHPIVYDDHLAAMAQAQQQNRWLLVNFTGFT